MNELHDRLRVEMRTIAEEITPDSVPPLSLRDRRPSRFQLTRKPGQATRWSVWRNRLAPLGAAVAVLAIVAAVVTVTRSHPTPRPAAHPGPASIIPNYYVALIPPGASTEDAVVRDSVTGATLATVRPPHPYFDFSMVNGTANDRTFVLAAQRRVKGPDQYATRFFVLRFDPKGNKAQLAALPVPEVPGSWMVTGLALSPDAAKLAVAVTTAAGKATAQLRVYTLAGGAARTWSGPGAIGFAPNDAESVSWAADDTTLAFHWTDGIRVLDVASPGRSLSDSRLAVADPQPGGAEIAWDGILTPDGQRVVAVMVPGPPAGLANRVAQVDVFSVSSGQLVRHTPAGHAQNILWTNASGSIVIIVNHDPGAKHTVVGTLRGHVFSPIKGAPAITELGGTVAW